MLLLSACWSGPPLFTSRDSVAGAIPDGNYIVREPAGPDGPTPFDKPSTDDAMRVRAQPDGALRLTAGGGDEVRDLRVIAVPLLAAKPRRFVLQIEDRKRRAAPGDASYLLLDAQAKPLRLYILACDADARRAVESSGGFVSRDPQSASQCIFRDQATLVKELRRVVALDPPARETLELVPLP